MKKFIALLGLSLVMVGCGRSDVASDSESSDGAGDSAYLVQTEPEGALPVGEARKVAKNDEEVTLVGLIGGSAEPFVNGIAAFTIVDAKVPYCAADEGCATPWDYCCETVAVKDNIATIKVVDEAGAPVSQDARKLLNVKELSTVVVHGTAKRDELGNLTVSAKQVFVRPSI